MHIITLATKAITTQYYGRAILRSYISSCSKGGQAVLKAAQQFPDDYDGYLPIAPVYDMAGRVIAGAWFAQAVNDGRGGSVLTPAVAAAMHKSVLARCGAQAGVDEGLVTDPATCDWRPEMVVRDATLSSRPTPRRRSKALLNTPRCRRPTRSRSRLNDRSAQRPCEREEP